MKRKQRKSNYKIGQKVYILDCEDLYDVDTDVEYLEGTIADTDDGALCVVHHVLTKYGIYVRVESDCFGSFEELYNYAKACLERSVQDAGERVNDCKEELAAAKSELKRQNKRLAKWLSVDPRCK